MAFTTLRNHIPMQVDQEWRFTTLRSNTHKEKRD
jgi:hypothetical protein